MPADEAERRGVELAPRDVDGARALFSIATSKLTTSPTFNSSNVTPFNSLEWKLGSFVSPSRAIESKSSVREFVFYSSFHVTIFLLLLYY